MKSGVTYLTFLALLLNAASCTNTRWSVKDTSAIDYNDYRILQSQEFLQEAGRVTPEDPVLKLQLFSYTTYEYAEKVLVERNIQEYRPRPGWLALGLAGAILSVYAANTDAVTSSESSLKRITLNTAGGLMALSGLLNMKPVGEPRNTGEERFLRKTGTDRQTDTLEVTSPEDDQVDVTIRYGARLVQEEQDRTLNGGLLEINLGGMLNSMNIRGSNPDSVIVEVVYRDSTYSYTYPLQEVLRPFARIITPVTPLRNEPVEDESNVLAELVEGGELQIADRSDPEWYRVLYGISENYIHRSDAELIWRSSEFARDNQLVAVPRVPFGNIDVETNIPILRSIREGTAGLIITNEDYEGSYTTRTYAHRDGELIGTYLENALGYPSDHIFIVRDLSGEQQLSEPLSGIESVATDSTELFVYLSGYGSVSREDGEIKLGFVPAGEGSQTAESIDLAAFFRRIASIPAEKVIVVADIDFSRQFQELDISERELNSGRPYRELARIITSYNRRSAVLFGAELNQESAVYLSGSAEDKKHRIFPYFLARALQQRLSVLGEIYQYLQRNVSYNARRLHDHSQDPQLYGRISIDLAED